MTKLVVAGGAVVAWFVAVPVFAVLAVLGGPGPAAGVPVAAPVSSAPAIRAALSLVGANSGWYRLCDRLACRAYGHANSGYASASVHWGAMLAAGFAHPGDRCPPPGSFVFWSTSSADGHVALVASSDADCDSSRITLVSNDVLDAERGNIGGVYHVTLARIESGFVATDHYLGWSEPVCAGVAMTVLADGASA
ncbi:MAG: hypothetical protein ACT4P1_11245 [Sporichthyaceae bacterium]